MASLRGQARNAEASLGFAALGFALADLVVCDPWGEVFSGWFSKVRCFLGVFQMFFVFVFFVFKQRN